MKLERIEKRIEDYYNNQAVGQSHLKKLFYLKNPMDIFKEEKISKESFFRIGSAVDALITCGNDYFYNKFRIIDENNKATDKVKLVVEKVAELVQPSFLETNILELQHYQEEILSACVELEYQSNWKPETKVNSILEKGSEYFELLQLSKLYTILSSEEYSIVQSCVDRLLNGKYTSHLFNGQLLFQIPLYFQKDNVDLKCLLDMIYVDHENKTFRVVDLKTTSKSVIDFKDSFSKFGYNIQLWLYSYALSLHYKELGLSDYEQLTPMLIVVSTTYLEEPASYFELTEVQLDNGGYGDDFGNPGFKQIFYYYKYYQEHDYTEHKLIREQQGHFYL